MEWLGRETYCFLPLAINPNPTYNSVKVNLPDNLYNKGFLLRLYTTDGKLLKQFAADAPEIWLDLEMIPSGLYLLYLWDSSGRMLISPTKIVKLE
jgi:hypothetical protein